MPRWPVWIESDLPLATAQGRRAALYAQDPFDALSGGPQDWPRLARALAQLSRSQGSARAVKSASEGPFPRAGLAAGFIRYDGSFWFGFYKEAHILDEEAFPLHNTDLPAEPGAPYHCGSLSSSLSRAEYCARVERIHEYIAAGDIYQVNLTRRLSADFSGSSRALFSRLKDCSPAPFSAYLECPELTVASASPELFLRFSGSEITTRPIKGTRPRFRDAQADAQSAYELMRSEKELAELLMITDLQRNDLGQICRYGSVEVTDLIRRESYAQVHHLMSNITGWLRPDITPAAALRACFPGGSITGAPKRRACEIIAELEPVPRGLYCGSIGYFGFDGECQFNIAIRTLELHAGRVSFGVGAGITTDSQPQAEFEETEHKAAGLRAALTGLPRHALLPAAPQKTT